MSRAVYRGKTNGYCFLGEPRWGASSFDFGSMYDGEEVEVVLFEHKNPEGSIYYGSYIKNVEGNIYWVIPSATARSNFNKVQLVSRQKHHQVYSEGITKEYVINYRGVLGGALW